MATTSYAIGLGSNRYRGDPPKRIIARAIDALAESGVSIEAISPIVSTPPLGPGRRYYANAVILAETPMSPGDLLALCKKVESRFGRRRGRRWGDRALDIDILLWSDGIWASEGLIVPHISFRERDFVLAPLAAIAGEWRDPVSGLTIRQLKHRLNRANPVDPASPHP